MSLEVKGQLAVYKPFVRPLPLITVVEDERQKEDVASVDQEIEEIAARSLTPVPEEDEGSVTPIAARALTPVPEEDEGSVSPIKESEKPPIEVKWNISSLHIQSFTLKFKSHLQENFISQGYKFAVRSCEANLTDAISLLLRLDTSCDKQYVKDGKTLRDYALSYIDVNKAEMQAEIAKQLRSIVELLVKEVYFENVIKKTHKFDEILEQLPYTVSQFVNAYALNLFMLPTTQMHAEFAEADKIINDFIDNQAVSQYGTAIAECDPTADRLLLWILTNLFQRSISIWSEMGTRFEENHYCRKGIVDDKTIHLIQLKDGYGVLLPPKTKRRQLLEYTLSKNQNF